MPFLQTDDAGVQNKGHGNGKGIGRDKGHFPEAKGCDKEVAYDAPGGGDDPAKEAVQGVVVPLGVEKGRKNAGKGRKGCETRVTRAMSRGPTISLKRSMDMMSPPFFAYARLSCRCSSVRHTCAKPTRSCSRRT